MSGFLHSDILIVSNHVSFRLILNNWVIADGTPPQILFEVVFLLALTSPAGSLLAVKLHSENRVILNGKYEILISLILQWQDNLRKTMRNQLSLIIG